MHRFFLEPDALSSPSMLQPGSILRLPDKVAHQVRVVLHLQVGEQLVLLDNSGDEALCTITSSERSGVQVLVQERRAGKSASPVHIVLCQGLLKSARFEWILEKGTELGVSTFAPILCRRSMSGLEDAGPAKIQRWQRIIQEATEQCGRARLPTLLPIRPLTHALNDIPAGALALMPWEEERDLSLHHALKSRTTLKTPITIVLFIGPEGGLMAEEVYLAQRHGVLPVTLGPRILRAETAALAAIASVMYEVEAL
jgi:16S rRNA (uracil1498-N3)-methyltransferase